MEKLQKAIVKAREERVKGRAQHGVSVAHAPASDPWPELQSFEGDRLYLERHRIVADVAGPKATPYDILRTKIMLTMRRNNWRRLAITSPMAGAGKTLTACNLALALSRQEDMRSMLFEIDLRRPSQRKVLGIPEGPGIAELLCGEVSFEQQALCLRPNLAISSACGPLSDPSSVLLSKRTQQILQDIEDQYEPDVMVFDLPPLLSSDDARAFLKNADCALMIAAAETTKITHIDACEREIAEQTNMLGVVLNQCKHLDDLHGSYNAVDT